MDKNKWRSSGPFKSKDDEIRDLKKRVQRLERDLEKALRLVPNLNITPGAFIPCPSRQRYC